MSETQNNEKPKEYPDELILKYSEKGYWFHPILSKGTKYIRFDEHERIFNTQKEDLQNSIDTLNDLVQDYKAKIDMYDQQACCDAATIKDLKATKEVDKQLSIGCEVLEFDENKDGTFTINKFKLTHVSIGGIEFMPVAIYHKSLKEKDKEIEECKKINCALYTGLLAEKDTETERLKKEIMQYKDGQTKYDELKMKGG